MELSPSQFMTTENTIGSFTWSKIHQLYQKPVTSKVGGRKSITSLVQENNKATGLYDTENEEVSV